MLDENLCHGQKIYASANSRKGGALCSSVTRVLGGDLDAMWNTKWFYTKFHLIASVSHHSFSRQNITCFSPGQTSVWEHTSYYPKIEDTKLEVGASVLSIPKLYSRNFIFAIQSFSKDSCWSCQQYKARYMTSNLLQFFHEDSFAQLFHSGLWHLRK